MCAPISTTNGAFLTPRFLAAVLGLVSVKSDVCRRDANSRDSSILSFKRDLLQQVLQVEDGALGCRVLARRQVQRRLGSREVQIVGLDAGHRFHRRRIGVNREKQIRLVLVGDLGAVLERNVGVVGAGEQPRCPGGPQAAPPAAARRPAPGPSHTDRKARACRRRGRRGPGSSTTRPSFRPSARVRDRSPLALRAAGFRLRQIGLSGEPVQPPVAPADPAYGLVPGAAAAPVTDGDQADGRRRKAFAQAVLCGFAGGSTCAAPGVASTAAVLRALGAQLHDEPLGIGKLRGGEIGFLLQIEHDPRDSPAGSQPRGFA